MQKAQPEPWLRGPIPDVSPLIAPVLYALQQAHEDLANHTAGLTDEQMWARPFGLAPVGFQLRHIAGSVDRLTTYLLCKQLDKAQMAALEAEKETGETLAQLLAGVNDALALGEQRIRSIDPGSLAERRVVGRQQLPTTVIGLLVHIAEHTQRHVGQAISAAKLARGKSAG
jgi:uncharacterized damage-inducible protein DinB